MELSPITNNNDCNEDYRNALKNINRNQADYHNSDYMTVYIWQLGDYISFVRIFKILGLNAISYVFFSILGTRFYNFI